jgi:hypothetical protein
LAFGQLAKQRALAREDFIAELFETLDQTMHGGHLEK